MNISKCSTVSMRLFGTALISAFLLMSTCVAAESTPTPEELVALVQAAHEQYRCIDVEFTVSRFESEYDTQEQEFKGAQEHIHRVKNERIYSTRASKVPNADGILELTDKVSYAFTPSWAKKLHEAEGARPRALIERSTSMIGELEVDPRRAMWAPFGEQTWRKFTNSNSTVQRDDRTGCLILTYQGGEGAPRSVVTVDPARGYSTVRSELQRPDGTVGMRFELVDFKQVEGELWLPFTYTFEMYSPEPEPGYYRNVYTVTKAHVNTDIPEEMLNLRFPAGTIVQDKIAGLRYAVGDDAVDDVGPVDDIGISAVSKGAERDVSIVTPEDTWATRPASDADLDAVGKKMALREQSVHGASSFLYVFIFGGMGCVVAVPLVWLSRRRRSHVKS